MLARRVGVAGITAGLRGLRVGAPACARCLATAPSERERTPTPEQVAANPADDVADASRRADIDRRRDGSTRENVAATELGEDISAGRSRTYVREDDIEKQTAATLYEILRQDLHRRQNLPLLREGVNLKRTGSGLAHTPDVRDVWLTPDGDRPAEKQKKTERQRQRDKHVVPQHRKYLAHGKVRTGGSPFKRQKLENNRRAVVARQRIAEREREAQGVEEEEKPQNAEGYQQLVEEKIQLAMSQGELDPTKNRYVGVDMLALSRGEGDPEVAAAFGRNGTRPAHVSTADFLVGERDRSQAILSLDCGFHTVALRVAQMNRMLKNQGAAPPWVFTKKDINADVLSLREDLERCWRLALQRSGGSEGRAVEVAIRSRHWLARVEQAEEEAKSLNRRIRDYNLACPAPCARMAFYLERELGRVVHGDPKRVTRDADHMAIYI